MQHLEDQIVLVPQDKLRLITHLKIIIDMINRLTQ